MFSDERLGVEFSFPPTKTLDSDESEYDGVDEVDEVSGEAFDGVEMLDGGAGCLGGRPRFGLSASTASSLRYATFTSEIWRTSKRSAPCLLRPTFISIVLLVGLDVTGNGPRYLGPNPFTLCCLT